MTKIIAAAAISLAAIMPFATTSAFAETAETQTRICDQTAAEIAKAGVDCTTTSTIGRSEDAPANKYPDAPVSFGSGVVF
ncbi:hypothetical protein IMCC20628_00308 [Hoeflea sp. IMCC20628]|uniref:hypothetical protein n=1 Tax=Hoeflea sp. IMCC20628 TaxID=1620421 RepID=UPI00063AB6C2|nr:hypothetical protein [Hoeflea sp. IMCC20628]AKH99037.1 hypothetical protein IMCC20628_00308 [Hoeflea sp. IMCC20628]